MAGPVTLERDGALAILTLAKPPLNLFDRPLLDALGGAIDDVAADPPRGLLVRAEGRAVSGGVDVHLFDGLSVQDAAALWRELLDLVHTVEELPLPTVFAAHALCLTAAFELSLACDLLIAAQSARFGLVETVVGLTPAMGGTQRLAEGPTRAHAATKAIVRAQVEGGARAADERVPEVAGDLFATEDLQAAVRSFLEKGPGHATYTGR